MTLHECPACHGLLCSDCHGHLFIVRPRSAARAGYPADWSAYLTICRGCGRESIVAICPHEHAAWQARRYPPRPAKRRKRLASWEVEDQQEMVANAAWLAHLWEHQHDPAYEWEVDGWTSPLRGRRSA